MIEKDGVTVEDAERQRCEIWSRVMGYHRPVSNWNKGKIGEFEERTYFTEKALGTKSCCADKSE